jgi:hypothetical protein
MKNDPWYHTSLSEPDKGKSQYYLYFFVISCMGWSTETLAKHLERKHQLHHYIGLKHHPTWVSQDSPQSGWSQ